MTRPGRPFVLSVVWTVIGALALISLTAGITIAVSSLRTADRTSELLAQLRDANTQIDALSADNAATRAAADRLDRQNRRLIQQNAHRAAQVDALIQALRQHGLDVPKPQRQPAAAEGGGASPPKAPATHSGASQPHSSPSPSDSPGSPAPIGTTPPSTTADPLTELTCRLVPVLCP